MSEVYLFGTVHFSDPRVVKLHPIAESAFRKAHRVYTESDLSRRGTEKLQKFIMRSPRTTLSSSLGKNLVMKAEAELKALSAKRSLESFERQKTWALWSVLGHLVNCGEGRRSLDTELWNRASSRRKTVIALEDLEEQLGGLNSLPESEQVGLLVGYLDTLLESRRKGVHPSQAIFDAYLTGDMKKMKNAVERKNKTPSSLNKKFKKIMLDDRNKRIAAKIETEALSFPKKIHFFAVGVSHYISKKSIIDLLQKKGYKITRITQ